MKKIKIGYDDNLGFPIPFADSSALEILSYHDLEQMIQLFNEQDLAGVFTPAGTLPYIHDYEIIAQASLGPQNQTTLQTYFVSLNNITISEIPKLLLGRVNQYCTTSFWAPLIFFMDHFPADTKLYFNNTNGFQDMLHQTAIGNLDGSMVWDIILQQNPQDTQRVNQFFKKNDLPAPVFIAQKNNTSILNETFLKFGENGKKPESFFQGFMEPDLHLIQEFIRATKKASSYFRINSSI